MDAKRLSEIKEQWAQSAQAINNVECASHGQAGILARALGVLESNFSDLLALAERAEQVEKERDKILRALCIRFDPAIAAEDGDAYEVPAEPEPLYVDTLPKAVAKCMAIVDKACDRAEAQSARYRKALEEIRDGGDSEDCERIAREALGMPVITVSKGGTPAPSGPSWENSEPESSLTPEQNTKEATCKQNKN